jgi:hypothetical protein
LFFFSLAKFLVKRRNFLNQNFENESDFRGFQSPKVRKFWK